MDPPLLNPVKSPSTALTTYSNDYLLLQYWASKAAIANDCKNSSKLVVSLHFQSFLGYLQLSNFSMTNASPYSSILPSRDALFFASQNHTDHTNCSAMIDR